MQVKENIIIFTGDIYKTALRRLERFSVTAQLWVIQHPRAQCRSQLKTIHQKKRNKECRANIVVQRKTNDLQAVKTLKLAEVEVKRWSEDW